MKDKYIDDLNKILLRLDRRIFKNIYHAKLRLLISELIIAMGETPRVSFKIKPSCNGEFNVYRDWILIESFRTKKAANEYINDNKKIKSKNLHWGII